MFDCVSQDTDRSERAHLLVFGPVRSEVLGSVCDAVLCGDENSCGAHYVIKLKINLRVQLHHRLHHLRRHAGLPRDLLAGCSTAPPC